MGIGIRRNTKSFWGGLGVGGVSRLRNEPVLFNQRSMFYTAWKMYLSAADKVWLGYSGLRPRPTLGSAPIFC